MRRSSWKLIQAKMDATWVHLQVPATRLEASESQMPPLHHMAQAPADSGFDSGVPPVECNHPSQCAINTKLNAMRPEIDLKMPPNLRPSSSSRNVRLQESQPVTLPLHSGASASANDEAHISICSES